MASRIADILVRANLLDDLQLRSALAHQQQWGGRLPAVVVEKHFAPEEKVTQAIADALKLPKVDLGTIKHDKAALAKVDMDFARVNGVFPCAVKDDGKTLFLAMCDPTDVLVADEVAHKGRVRLKLVVSSERQIQAAIRHHYLGETASSHQDASYGSIMQGDLSESSDEDGKVVDASGHTMIKNIKDIRPTEVVAPPKPSAVASASDLLDDMIGGGVSERAGPQWSQADLQRLYAIQDLQKKGSSILRAALDLCVAKGYFTADELQRQVKKS